jgi:hypothetical protein
MVQIKYKVRCIFPYNNIEVYFFFQIEELP